MSQIISNLTNRYWSQKWTQVSLSPEPELLSISLSAPVPCAYHVLCLSPVSFPISTFSLPFYFHISLSFLPFYPSEFCFSWFSQLQLLFPLPLHSGRFRNSTLAGKVIFRCKKENSTFLDKQKLRKFIMTRPAL